MSIIKYQNNVLKLTLSFFKGKQKAKILWYLYQQPLRFSELKQLLDPISKKVLSDQLHQLEDNKLIMRTVYPEVPVKVVYSLTDVGRSIDNLFSEFHNWKSSNPSQYSPEHIIIDIISDKWKSSIIQHLYKSKLRFGELKKELHPISQKILTENLRDLEQYDLIRRTIFNDKIPKTEYELTELGYSLIPVFIKIYDWGEYYLSVYPEKKPLQ